LHDEKKREDISIANLQKLAVAERREAEPTTQHRNELGLAVLQATIELLHGSYRQCSLKPINKSSRSHTDRAIATHNGIS